MAQAYAERLNLKAQNLKKRQIDALHQLLSGYPSHGFVIDISEATQLFRNVKPFSDEIAEVVRHLGADAIFPRNRRSDQSPRVEFLNEPVATEEPTQEISTDGQDSRKRRRKPDRQNGAGDDVFGTVAEGGSSVPPEV